jgi:hypothetical protein
MFHLRDDLKRIAIKFGIRLNFGNACYHSVQSLLSSLLLPKSIKIKIQPPLEFEPPIM